MDYPICDYSCKSCGENSSASVVNVVQPPYTVSINGNTNLSGCMKANGGGCVYGITLTGSPGTFDWVLNVDAQGPSGIGSGSMYLAFTDQTGDTYKLSIYSSTRSVHTVRYNSDKPAITKIQWSNNSI